MLMLLLPFPLNKRFKNEWEMNNFIRVRYDNVGYFMQAIY